MAGIYIHIPFCVSRCGYCDFYKTTNFSYRIGFLEALLKEIELRRGYICGEVVETIYFGGGTPTTLDISYFKMIFEKLRSTFIIDPKAEITIECNPDDITFQLLEGLQNLGANRLSIGMQSFDDNVLQFMQRRHDSNSALEAIKLARLVGFDNISIDLIYGLPNISIEDWRRNLEIALSLKVEHISAYHLTYESGTNFDKLLKRGEIKEVDEESSVSQFELLLDTLQENGYEQYEVSNFCRSEKYSKHNSNYWKGVYYLGLGPSAHSFNGDTRSWNIANLSKYISSIERGTLPLEIENLSQLDKYNELLMVGLRTKWGVDIKQIESLCSPTLLTHFRSHLSKQIELGNLVVLDGKAFLPANCRMVSDSIILDLFYSSE